MTKKMKKTWTLLLSFLAIAVLQADPIPSGEMLPQERQEPFVASAASNWSTPVNISNTNRHSFTPRIGVDKDGNAYVIWADWTDVPDTVYFKTNKSGQWSGIQVVHRMSYESSEACFPELATSLEGECHLVLQDVLASYEILHYEYKNNSWKGPENVSSDPGGAAIYGTVAVSPTNNYAYAVWMGEVQSEWDLLYSYREPGTTFGWDWPELIPLFGGYQYFPNATVDGKGTLHLVFHTRDGENSTVWYVKNPTPTNNANWTRPITVAANVGAEWSYPRIDSDNNGDVYVVWNGRTSQGHRDVFLRKTVNEVWQGIENVSQSQNNSDRICIGVSRRTGEFYVSWHEIVGVNWQVLFRAFEKERAGEEKKWSGVVNISNAPDFAAWPRLAVADYGDVHLVYSDRRANIFDVFYTSKPKIWVSSPVDLALRTSFNKVLFYSEKINTITFSRNPENEDAIVASYNLYRREASESDDQFQLLATLSNTQFRYDDRQLPHAVKYAYTVTTTDIDGNESRRTAIVTEQ